MVDLAQMLAAQRAQSAAQPTTPPTESERESDGQQSVGTNTTKSETGGTAQTGTEAGPVGTETQPADGGDAFGSGGSNVSNGTQSGRTSEPQKFGSLAGLRLNAGGDSAGTSDSSAGANQQTPIMGEGTAATFTNDANDTNHKSGDPAGDVRDAGLADTANPAASGLAGLNLNPSSSAPPPASTHDAPPVVAAKGPGDSLRELSLSTVGSSGIPDIQSVSGFSDEIPATAPARELPADMTPEMESFVKSLNNIYLVMDDPELFAQVIRSIMMELQSSPQYIKLIADDDVMVMIRGMRESMGLAKMRKESKRRTSSTESKKKAAKSDAMFDTLASLAQDMGLETE